MLVRHAVPYPRHIRSRMRSRCPRVSLYIISGQVKRLCFPRQNGDNSGNRIHIKGLTIRLGKDSKSATLLK
jgi:hypothetical protein